jgi:hypothetical protein
MGIPDQILESVKDEEVREQRRAEGKCPRCGKTLTEQEKQCAIKLCDDCYRYQRIIDEYGDEYGDEVEPWED